MKYTHKQCYSRHVIPFLPVVRSLQGLAIPEQYREIGGLFRCYRRFIIARVFVEIGFLCTRRNFPFYRDGFRLCHRPFNRLKCVSHSEKPPFDCLHFAHDSWDQSSIFIEFNFWFTKRNIYHVDRETSSIECSAETNVRFVGRDQSENLANKFALCLQLFRANTGSITVVYSIISCIKQFRSYDTFYPR